MCIRACIHVYMYTCIHVYMYTCTYTYIRIYIYIYVYIRVYIHVLLLSAVLALFWRRERPQGAADLSRILHFRMYFVCFSTLERSAVVILSVRSGLGCRVQKGKRSAFHQPASENL